MSDLQLNKIKLQLALVCLFFLISCKDPFLYNINEIRLNEDERNLNAKNILKIQMHSTRDTLKFILTGDSQRFYEELEVFVTHVNRLEKIGFVVLNGDITDFGLNKEYRLVNDRLKKLNIPYLGIIGNHDMLANGRVLYNEMFGPENFSFFSNNNKFICLNTNSREVGNNGTVPNIPWLSLQLRLDSNYRNAFVIGHVPPFDNDFDKKLEGNYSKLLSSNKKIRLSMHGHQHSFKLVAPYNDGLQYLVVGSMNKRSYALISVWDDNYKIEEVDY